MMPKFNWKVTYDGATVLSDITGITVSRGRQQIQDPFRAGTAVIEGRNLAGLPTIEVGKEVNIEILIGSTVYGSVFTGIVSDVQFTYGFTTDQDTWTIDVEDNLAVMGRAYTTAGFSFTAGDTVGQAMEDVAGDATGGDIGIGFFGSFTTSSKVSAQSLGNTNALELLNTLAFTEQAFLFSDGGIITCVPRSALGQGNLVGELTDDASAVLVPTFFDKVEFRSFADSYYDRVVIEPAGLTAQAVGTGTRSFTGSSFDETTTQASNLADYVKATLDVQDQVPSVISCLAEAQPNYQLAQMAEISNSFCQISLRLRGDDYTLFLLGLRLTVTPDSSRFTFNVASSEALNFFVLDSTTFGVLDTSRLGF